jgi:hypothetical protein
MVARIAPDNQQIAHLSDHERAVVVGGKLRERVERPVKPRHRPRTRSTAPLTAPPAALAACETSPELKRR